MYEAIFMDFLTFEDLQARFQELYREQAYQEALELATDEAESFPEYSHLLYYWRVSSAARLAGSERYFAGRSGHDGYRAHEGRGEALIS